MPTSWMQKTGARSGRAGAFAMGLLVGVVAAPCVGGFVLGLLAFVAARQDAALGFLFFFVLSLGLGLPYLFLAAFSGSLSRLPRAGEWMEGVKKVFGWILLAMAAYFLRTSFRAPPGTGSCRRSSSSRQSPSRSARPRLRPAARAAAAVVFLAAAAFFLPRRIPLPPLRAGSPTPRSRSRARAARRSSTSPPPGACPAVELDEKTFSDPAGAPGVGGRALFKADMTRSASPEVVALAEKYAILGVPTIIFLDAAGRERQDLRLVGFEDADAFLKRLEKAP